MNPCQSSIFFFRKDLRVTNNRQLFLASLVPLFWSFPFDTLSQTHLGKSSYTKPYLKETENSTVKFPSWPKDYHSGWVKIEYELSLTLRYICTRNRCIKARSGLLMNGRTALTVGLKVQPNLAFDREISSRLD